MQKFYCLSITWFAMKFIEAMHIYNSKDGGIHLKNNKKYIWAIPKELEKKNISQSDIVLALCKKIKLLL